MKIKEAGKEGASSGEATSISPADEERLYRLGKLGRSTPQQLVDTIMFKVGKLFGFLSGEELRDFRYSNLTFDHKP